MRAETKAVLFSLFLGGVAWFATGLLAEPPSPLGPEASGSLWLDLLACNLPGRCLVLGLFLVSGVATGRVLGQRRRAQDELRESRSRYVQLFERAPEGMWEIGLDGTVTQANEALCELVGLSPERVLGHRCSDIMRNARCGSEQCPLRHAAHGAPPEFEAAITRPDGRQALCVVRSRRVPGGLAQAFHNVTEHRAAEARFQALVETTGDGVTVIDPQGYITYANDAFAQMLGYEPDELVGRTGVSLCDEDNQRILEAQLERRVTGAEDRYELEYTARNGDPVSVLISATPLFDPQGGYAGSFAVMKNVTELKHAEARTAHLNSVLRAIRNVNQLITREDDRDRLLQQACDCLIETRGYDFAGVLCVDPEEGASAYAAGDRTVAAGWQDEALHAEALAAVAGATEPRATLVHAGRSPALRWWQGSWPEGRECLAVRLECSGQGYGVLAVLIPAAMAGNLEEHSLFEEVAGDLAFALHAIGTERQRARYAAQVAAEHERSHCMLEMADALIVSLDPTGRITFFNRCCEEVTGFRAEEVIGSFVWDKLVPPRLFAQLQTVFHDLTDVSESNSFENPWLTRDGRERLISWRNTRLCDADGQVLEIVGVGLDVTEHRAAETAVHENERRYRLLFNSGQDAIFVFELQPDGAPGCFLEANDVALDTFGYSRAELLTMGPERLDAPGDETEVADLMARLTESRHVLFTQDHITRDGRIIPMEVNAHLFEFEGRPAVLSVARDITERRQAEEQLAHLNSVLLAVRNVNQLITRETDRDKLLQGACNCLVAARGYSMAGIALANEDEVSATYVAAPEWATDEVAASVSASAWKLLRRPGVSTNPVVVGAQQCEWAPPLADEWLAGRTCLLVRLEWGGTTYGLLGISLPVRMATNADEQSLFLEVADDLAFALHTLDLAEERRQALARLELTQFAVDRAADSVFWIDREGRILYVNQSACTRLGYTADELMQMRILDLDPNMAEDTWDAHWDETRSDEGVTIESTHRASDGRLIPVEVTINHFLFDGEEYHFTFARDITERKRAEQELQRLNQRYELLVESQLVETFIIQRDRLIFANRAMHEKLGYEPGALVGKPVLELLPAARHGGLLAWHEARQRGLGTVADEFETQVQTAGGTLRWVQVWAQDIGEFEGMPTVIGHMVDVTEARELRLQLEHSQRLEGLGTLAGGVAHEFNNVLQAILLNASLLQVERALSQPEAEKVKSIVERTEYGARLTEQLLTFSRRAPVQYRTLDLNVLIEEALALLSRTVPRQIQIACDCAPGLWTVNADGGRLKQVLINLALNARDAMPHGGQLAFETANVMLDAASLAALPKLRPGPHVLVTVSDTGAGMSPETLRRAFEPFFTTKGVGQGTGLGLSIVHGIIDAHSGAIRVHSAPGAGTTFQIYLPAEPEAEPTTTAPAVATTARGGSETILIVDDEVDLLRGAAAVLRKFGYTVLTADGGQRALDLCAAGDPPIDLMVLDLIMPDLSGEQTLTRLREFAPSLPVIIASGCISDEDRTRHEGCVAAHLEKPFAPDRMLAVVRRVLDER